VLIAFSHRHNLPFQQRAHFYDEKENAVYVETTGTNKSNIELIVNY